MYPNNTPNNWSRAFPVIFTIRAFAQPPNLWGGPQVADQKTSLDAESWKPVLSTNDAIRKGDTNDDIRKGGYDKRKS